MHNTPELTDVAPTASPVYTLDDLLYLMARLRSPEDGCPWDLKQSFQSIVPYTLEEVYEVVDAIEREDYPHLKEELGDLLFQVVFYTQLAEEQSLFEFSEVVSTLVEKLVVRHPHVFPDGSLHSKRKAGEPHADTDIKQNWEVIKRQARAEKGQKSMLADIPLSIPALARAAKLQKRAASCGFDWPTIEGVVDKLDEEVGEAKAAILDGNKAAIEEELGDVLFSVVNLCRHLGVDAEGALRQSSRKFEHRFAYIE